MLLKVLGAFKVLSAFKVTSACKVPSTFKVLRVLFGSEVETVRQ